MFGYDCPIEGAYQQYVGTPDAAAYFSNLRVVRLQPPGILAIMDAPNGGTNNVTIQFTSSDGDATAGSFSLQSSGTNSVAGPYADVSGAAITQILTSTGTALFQATASLTNSAQFYRVRYH
jgi:hypothetical protein